MTGLWDVSPMNKTHQVWQRLNIMLCGFLMGQIYHVPERFTLWLPLRMACIRGEQDIGNAVQ